MAKHLGTRSNSDSKGKILGQEILSSIVNACQEAKGSDISLLNVSKIYDVAEYFVVVSGRSDRQVQGIANKVIQALAKFNIQPSIIEGMEEGHWVLIDFGDLVLHAFYEPTRKYYDVDTLWARAERIELKSTELKTSPRPRGSTKVAA